MYLYSRSKSYSSSSGHRRNRGKRFDPLWTSDTRNYLLTSLPLGSTYPPRTCSISLFFIEWTEVFIRDPRKNLNGQGSRVWVVWRSKSGPIVTDSWTGVLLKVVSIYVSLSVTVSTSLPEPDTSLEPCELSWTTVPSLGPRRNWTVS